MMKADGSTFLLAAVWAPLLFGVASMFLSRRRVTLRVLTALAGPVVSVGALAMYWSRFGLGAGSVSLPLVPSVGLNLDLIADPLGMFFGLLVSGFGCLIVLYARGYFGRDEASLFRFYPTLGFFATAMMGVVLSDSMLGMFLFWELTSVSSFLLIGWDRENPKAVRLAMQAFITTGLGGLALLGGIILLATQTGEWTFSGLAGAIEVGRVRLWTSPLIVAAFGLIFAGGAAKSAQFPLHFWLPGAMAAPTPVSAYLHSATMVKAGVYLFARFFPVLSVLSVWPQTLVAFGGVTMLYAAYLAVRSSELKKIFAYTTVSQLGLLTCMYGLGAFSYEGSGNLIWPVTQILNHAIYKAPLFIIAGAIMHLAGKKELYQLRGLIRSHPALALTALLAGYALAGGPMTLSFTAKEAFLYQIVHAAETNPALWLIGGMAVLTAAFNVAIFVRMLVVFVSRADASERMEHDAHAAADHPSEHNIGHAGHAHGHERGFWGTCIWWPALAIVVWQYIGGLAPALFERLVRPLETHTEYWAHLPSLIHAIEHPGAPLAMSGVAILLGCIIGLIPWMRTPLADPYNGLFPGFMRTVQWIGYRTFYGLQSGNMRRYVALILITLLLGVSAGTMLDADRWLLPDIMPWLHADKGIIMASVILTGIICFSALIMTMVQMRIVRVLALGLCGFSVTGMYLVYQAPDLALTQLMFEIISVVLFLLVLRLLPDDAGESPRVPRVPRLILCSLVGLVMGWSVLQAGTASDHFWRTQEASAGTQVSEAAVVTDGHTTTARGEPVAATRLGIWFTSHSYKGTEDTNGRGGGGNNVVNVTLVDFRGYDTLGEITVLSIAVMSVLAMLGATPGCSTTGSIRRLDTQACGLHSQPHLRSSLLRTSMRLILPLTLIFAGYMFFKGHNAAGGGFIAGLIAAVALAVFRMAEGAAALRRLLPVKPGTMAAIGLLIALLTAVVPMLFGLPLLRSGDSHIPLPGGGNFHLTSAMFFDLGVFIVVVGVSVGMINRFEEELE